MEIIGLSDLLHYFKTSHNRRKHMATSTIKNVNFLSKMYKANFTIQPNSNLFLTGNDLGMDVIPDYDPYAVVDFDVYNQHIIVNGVGFSTGTNTTVSLYNTTNDVINSTFQIRILFGRKERYKYIPYGS